MTLIEMIAQIYSLLTPSEITSGTGIQVRVNTGMDNVEIVSVEFGIWNEGQKPVPQIVFNTKRED